MEVWDFWKYNMVSRFVVRQSGIETEKIKPKLFTIKSQNGDLFFLLGDDIKSLNNLKP